MSNTSKMTFHESYGNVSARTLRLIRKYNVSPADYTLMVNRLHGGVPSWIEIERHIVSNSETGMYRPRYF